jgi:hypothetical protein
MAEEGEGKAAGVGGCSVGSSGVGEGVIVGVAVAGRGVGDGVGVQVGMLESEELVLSDVGAGPCVGGAGVLVGAGVNLDRKLLIVSLIEPSRYPEESRNI